MKNKGVVVKVKNSYCIVLDRDGAYHRVPVSGRSGIRVGAKLEFTSGNWFNRVKPTLMVASILLLALGFSLYQIAGNPQAVAYVSLDINPSVELEVSEGLKVLKVNFLNDAAQKMISSLQLQGTDLYTSVSRIMAEAVREGYLKPGHKNYVLTTVTVINDQQGTVDYDALTRNLEIAVEDRGMDVDILVLSSDLSTRNEATKQGLSPGKLILYREAIASGEKLTLGQVKQNSLSNLVNVYKVKWLPNNKKVIVKSVHIPPRHGNNELKDSKGNEKDSARAEKSWKNGKMPQADGEDNERNPDDTRNRNRPKNIEPGNPRKVDPNLNQTPDNNRSKVPRQENPQLEDRMKNNDRQEKPSGNGYRNPAEQRSGAEDANRKKPLSFYP